MPTPQSVTVSQAPNGATLTASISCVGGANAAQVTLVGGTGPSPLTFTLTPISAPTSATPPTVACTVNVAGQGDGPHSTLSIPVNVTVDGDRDIVGSPPAALIASVEQLDRVRGA